jgi:tripartite-type tricarboxylate transporter receptor subunit TctC
MIRSNRRQVVVGTLATLASFAVQTARSQPNYPDRRIRVIVLSAPGGVGDSVIRLLAPRLEQELGQKFVIESKPGAGGNVGMLDIARADADGYTILLGSTGNFVINQFLTRSSLDPLAVVTPIASVAEIPIVFFVTPSFPARSFGEFIAHARANPGKLNYGSPGVGTVNHLLVERLQEVAGIQVTHVPYRGSPQAMLGLLAGEIQLYPVGLALGAAHLGEGKLAALAVTAERRMPMLPEVPTVTEAGLPDLTMSNWWGMAAPKGTPEPVIRRLDQAVTKALNDPVVAERFAALGMNVPTQTREQFSASLRTEAVLWSEIIQRRKLAVD